MTLKDLTEMLIRGIHPDNITGFNDKLFSEWILCMDAGQVSLADPIERDCYHFAKRLLSEFDLVPKT